MKLNKNLISISVLLIALVILLSSVAYAKPFTEAFKGGLIEINNFFEQENYKPYSKTIDFVFFSLLFISIYMIGVRYAFKEVKRPETLIAVLLGLMSAFLLVLGGFSATILLPYIPWLLYVLLFILYWWLLKGIKNKFWRFVLALLLTLLTIALVQGLFNSLTAPEVGTLSFLKDFGSSFKGLEFPGISAPGMPPYLQDLFEKPTTTTTTTEPAGTTTTTKTEPTKPEPAAEPGFFAKNNWIIPLLILLALLALGEYGRRKGWYGGLLKTKEKEAQPTPSEEQKKTEETIDDLIDDVAKVIQQKKEAINKIWKIIKTKEKEMENIDFLDMYHKKIDDPAFLLDRDHESYKNLMAEHEESTKLLNLERDLEKDLLEVMKIEDELIGKGKLPLGTWEREKFSGKPIELVSAKTQVEWYGKLEYWYLQVRMLQQYIEAEYTARLRTGTDLIVGREEDDQRPELAIPRSIPDFYGKVFARLEESFNVLNPKERMITGTAIDGLLVTIKQQIVQYYLWTKETERIEGAIKLLTDAKQLEKWLKKGWAERWQDIKDKQGDKLKRIFKQEKVMFRGSNNNPGLFKNLISQWSQLTRIRALLTALKSAKASMTEMQELYIIKEDGERLVDATKDAKNSRKGIILDGAYSVQTRIKEGVSPFRAACYVNGRKAGEIQTPEKKFDEIKFRFDGIGINQSGEYKITFVCISIAKEVYERRDSKSIKIYVVAPAQAQLVQPQSPTSAQKGQLGINVAVDPPDATDGTKGVEVGAIVKFNYEVMSGGLPLQNLQKTGIITDEKSLFPQNIGGVLASFNETTDYITKTPGKHIFKIMVYDVYGQGQKAEATKEIYVKEKNAALSTGKIIIVKIKKPSAELPIEQRTFYQGDYIRNLKAEVVGPRNMPVNLPKNFKFSWYISQGEQMARIHPRVIDPNAITSIQIPLNFTGDAKLGVMLYNQKDEFVARSREVDILIKQKQPIELTEDTAVGGYPRAIQRLRRPGVPLKGEIADEGETPYAHTPRAEERSPFATKQETSDTDESAKRPSSSEPFRISDFVDELVDDAKISEWGRIQKKLDEKIKSEKTDLMKERLSFLKSFFGDIRTGVVYKRRNPLISAKNNLSSAPVQDRFNPKIIEKLTECVDNKLKNLKNS